jgi:hypothetical protein
MVCGKTIFGYISSPSDNSTTSNLNLLEIVMKRFPGGNFPGFQGDLKTLSKAILLCFG